MPTAYVLQNNYFKLNFFSNLTYFKDSSDDPHLLFHDLQPTPQPNHNFGCSWRSNHNFRHQWTIAEQNILWFL